MPMNVFKSGDAVWIKCDGKRVAGRVLLASGNSKSLMLRFEAILDGHLNMMPVLRDDTGVYRSIMTGIEVKISPLGE